MTATRIAAAIACGAVFLALLIASVRLFAADILSHGSSLYARETAVQLFPGSVSYILSLADLRRQSDLDIRPQLRRATMADPLNARLFIDLGLECERAGDYDSARRYLIEGTRLSHEFLARWTLANYYFRRDDTPDFLAWMHSALEVGAPDLRPAFRLLWSSGIAPEKIASIIPEDKNALLAWLAWCVEEGRLDAARHASEIALQRWPQESAGLLSRYCAQLASSSGHRLQAVDLWNTLSMRGLQSWAPVFPARKPLVEDADFSLGPGSLAFGWHVHPVDGIIAQHYTRGERFELDGNEPENWVLLDQLLSLHPGARYTIRCRYESSGIPAGSGLGWRIQDPDTHVAWSQSPAFLSDGQKLVDLPFTVPASARFGVLSLFYTRAPGTVRITGWVRLLSVDLNSAA
jgi:tetratricopeptide (TPR) repeat protein